MCVTLDEKVVTTRKPHRCEWDGEAIPVGARAYHYVGLFEGDFQNWYMHPECHAAFVDTMADWGETCLSFDPYQQQRGKLAEW